MSNKPTSSKIIHNSYWYGIEVLFETGVFFCTSVAVARTLGPDAVGRYVFLVFITGIADRVGGLGLAAATRKYVADSLGEGRADVARAIYFRTLTAQILVALVVAVVAAFAVHALGDDLSISAYVLVASAVPALVGAIPTHVNLAREEMASNTRSSLVYCFVYAATVVASLFLGWGLNGLAAATLMARSCEMSMRLWSVGKWVGTLPVPAVGVIPLELAKRIRRFCAQNLALTSLSLIIAERSELIFLKVFCSPAELAFYSLGYGVAEKLLTLSRIFSGPATVSLMAESSRSLARLEPLVDNSFIYLALFVLPVHVAVAVFAPALVHVTYGPQYNAAASVVSVSVLLAIPKAFQPIPEIALRTLDKLNVVLVWMLVSGAANLGFDALLIPPFKALGAAIGNGLGQGMSFVGLWLWTIRTAELTISYRKVGGILCCAVLAGGAALPFQRGLVPAPSLLLGSVAAIVTFCFAVRFGRVLDAADLNRFTHLISRLPRRLHRFAQFGLALVVPSVGTR